MCPQALLQMWLIEVCVYEEDTAVWLKTEAQQELINVLQGRQGLTSEAAGGSHLLLTRQRQQSPL